MACAIFALTHVVTLMFYTIQVRGAVQGSTRQQPAPPPPPTHLRARPAAPQQQAPWPVHADADAPRQPARMTRLAPRAAPLQATTKMAVEGGYHRPPWLDVSVHAVNTVVAWADLLTSKQRSFSRRSERLSSCLILVYLG
jgi:hypothetical protein